MLVLIRGAGDIATGIACRLFRSGFSIVMTEIPQPTTVRCTAAFSAAVYEGKAKIEGILGVLANTTEEALALMREKKIPILVDEKGDSIGKIEPDVVIDAILAKKNMGTSKGDAPIVIGIGPGFEAGVDCHAVIETQRGHDLGRVLYRGKPEANTGIPGEIAGFTTERVLRAPGSGIFLPIAKIGDQISEGQVVAYVGEIPVKASIPGVLRGLLPRDTFASEGMKIGDIDPRCKREHCFTVSDKALAIGGGALEAILSFSSLCNQIS